MGQPLADRRGLGRAPRRLTGPADRDGPAALRSASLRGRRRLAGRSGTLAREMTEASPSPFGQPASPWTARVAGWSAKHRWPVTAVWFLATIGLFAASMAA